MFEKSLVDLIRGLRGHKGREGEYIQGALKECRSEIRSQDMDVKATALLKLIYLEMFGYDMTWAAFNVLEVMSSAKHMQKRVGYLGAVQSFRPDTEVLMLAENLLKKDLTSPSIPTLSLPLITLPHIITSSLALSILTDLLPRLTHSQPSVRKKTIVTLYRLALVYPETLRVAWPKIKERLLDEHEDGSVTAATVNVVCELGWRRPQDFLPLAPRLFELLIDGGNNWMAIKIIKLFAVLTPLEPRLIKKLVRPLTNLIQTTTAMSLLYECISGIIQGGILDGVESGIDVETVADMCISKLRGMIVLEGDPNLKYVALLAFNKIVTSHPALVSMQQDVILACLDDPDISIRLQALELASGMVSSENLQNIVNRLLKQLANAPLETDQEKPNAAEEGDNTDLEQRLVPDKRSSELPPIPDEYRQEIVAKILDMCAHNTYSNIVDFEWYIDILIRLIKHLPAHRQAERSSAGSEFRDDATRLAGRIGGQLIDISVRVKELRPDTVKAAETLTLISNRASLFANHSAGIDEIIKASAWICGEYASYLSNQYDLLNSLVHESSAAFAPTTIAIIVQAIPKVFAEIAVAASRDWNLSRKSTTSLMLARTTDFLEKLSAHPNLEVQERSVEFLELLKVGSEALSSLPNDSLEAPLLLTSALPNLFSYLELNPVSTTAQRKVPIPDDLNLDDPINPDLNSILQASQLADEEDDPSDATFNAWYYVREPVVSSTTILQPSQSSQQSYRPASPDESEPLSYQAPPSPTTVARIKAERQARTKDDPFYIASSGSGTSTPNHQISDILHRSNGNDELDIDSIPIIDLRIHQTKPSSTPTDSTTTTTKKKKNHSANSTSPPTKQSTPPPPHRAQPQQHNLTTQHPPALNPALQPQPQAKSHPAPAKPETSSQ